MVIFNHEDLCTVVIRRSGCPFQFLRPFLNTHLDFQHNGIISFLRSTLSSPSVLEGWYYTGILQVDYHLMIPSCTFALVHHFVPRCFGDDHLPLLHVWDPHLALHVITLCIWGVSRAHVGERMDFMHIFQFHFWSICLHTLLCGLIIFYICISLLYLVTEHVVLIRSCNFKIIITFYDPLHLHLYYFIVWEGFYFFHTCVRKWD